MAYKVFISHSMDPVDLPLVYSFAQYLSQCGFECYIAERDPKLGRSLAAKIEEAIDDCHCLVAFLTVGGSRSSYVNQEIGLAKAKKKLCIPVLEQGLDLRGLQVGDEYVVLDRHEPAKCATALGQYLLKLKASKDLSDTVGFAILAFLAGLALRK
jgi:hypothetical protein